MTKTEVETFIDHVLTHMTDSYDPAQAHEYYLRNRQLKGRAAAAKILPAPKSSAGPKGLVAKPVKGVKPKAVKAHVATNKEIEAHVVVLQAKLDALRKALAVLVKEAKKRSGIAIPDTKSTGSSTTKTGATKSSGPSKLTTAQKAEKAKKAREAYKKEQAQDPKAHEEELKAKIAEVIAKIQALKVQIAEAKKNSTSRSVGVRANTTQVGRNSQNGS